MKHFYISGILCVLLTVPAFTFSQTGKTYDPAIQTITDNVSGDTLWARLAQLVTLQRFSTNTSAIQSSNYLKDYFLSLGYDTVYFQTYNGNYIPNVIAIKYGETIPDSIILAGAHYDVYQSGAPGADDNGSGTVAVMEAGRVLANHDFKKTIRLVCFSGEEQGDVGSAAYSNDAYTNGDKIIGALCMDMIAYLKPGDPINSDVYLDSNSTSLRAAYASYTTMYIPGFTVANVPWPMGATSDVASFWDNGYKGIMPSEGKYDAFGIDNHMSPYMHTSQDVIGTSANSKDQATKITKSVVATLASIAELMPQTGITSDTYLALSTTIYPNPANDKACIRINRSSDNTANITVCDIYGKKISVISDRNISSGTNEIFIDTSNLPEGIYLVNISDHSGQLTKKLIVSR